MRVPGVRRRPLNLSGVANCRLWWALVCAAGETFRGLPLIRIAEGSVGPDRTRATVKPKCCLAGQVRLAQVRCETTVVMPDRLDRNMGRLSRCSAA